MAETGNQPLVTDSVLLDIERQTGAVFSGIAEPSPSGAAVLHFGDPTIEYRGAHDSAVVFDLSERTRIEITGNDRLAFLHNFCTNDIKSCKPGEGREAFVTNIKGRILGHIFAFVQHEAVWLDTGPTAADDLVPHFEKYLINQDVQVSDRTSEFGELLVTGPQALSVLNRIGSAVPELPENGHWQQTWKNDRLDVCRVDWLGQPGYLLAGSLDPIADVWRTCVAEGIQPAGSDVFNALRIEAGFPLYGLDISEQTLAPEAGRTRQAISFCKGCYLGQEPIARIDAIGHLNRTVCGVKLTEPGTAPPPGCVIRAPEDEHEIGQVTSAAIPYAETRPVMLAVLRVEFAQPGTKVLVDGHSESVPGTVFWPEERD